MIHEFPQPAPAGGSLVLLHGINGSSRVWAPVVGHLELRHRVLALNLPGHRGGRPWPDGLPVSLDTLADLELVAQTILRVTAATGMTKETHQ